MDILPSHHLGATSRSGNSDRDGIIQIFLQGLNYIIDVYKCHANSAIAASTLVRVLATARFPLFVGAMFENLGVAWAINLLGFLSVILIPVPILFFILEMCVRSGRECIELLIQWDIGPLYIHSRTGAAFAAFPRS